MSGLTVYDFVTVGKLAGSTDPGVVHLHQSQEGASKVVLTGTLGGRFELTISNTGVLTVSKLGTAQSKTYTPARNV